MPSAPKFKPLPALTVSTATKIDSLNTDELTLFHFLRLLVDIQYRHRYGEAIEWSSGQGYSKYIQSDTVLADQLPSVDNGLLGNSQREVSGI